MIHESKVELALVGSTKNRLLLVRVTDRSGTPRPMSSRAIGYRLGGNTQRLIGFRETDGGYLSEAAVMTLTPGAILIVNDSHRHSLSLVARRRESGGS